MGQNGTQRKRCFQLPGVFGTDFGSCNVAFLLKSRAERWARNNLQQKTWEVKGRAASLPDSSRNMLLDVPPLLGYPEPCPHPAL